MEFNIEGQSYAETHPPDLEKISSKSVHRGLIPKYDSPFGVIKQVGNVAYRLKRHPTFHIIFLIPYHQDMVDTTRQQAKHAPPMIGKQFDREVESILDYKMEGMSKNNRRTITYQMERIFRFRRKLGEECHIMAV